MAAKKACRPAPPRPWPGLVTTPVFPAAARRPAARPSHPRGFPGAARNCVQSGLTLAPRCPHFVHRMRGPNDSTRTSSGQSSTLKMLRWPQDVQVTSSERGPRLRMLPSDMPSGICRLPAGGADGFLPGVPVGRLPMENQHAESAACSAGRLAPRPCRSALDRHHPCPSC